MLPLFKNRCSLPVLIGSFSLAFSFLTSVTAQAQQLYVTSHSLSQDIAALNPSAGFTPTVAVSNAVAYSGNVAIARDGTIYESDFTNSLIWKYNTNGTRQSIAATGGSGWGLAIGPDGSLFYGNYFNGSIYKIDPAGNTTELAHLFDGGGTQPARLTLLHIGTDGNLYTTQGSGFTPNSNVVWKVDMGGNITQVASGFGMGFQAVAQNRAGDLFVTAAISNEVYKISKSGIVSEFLHISQPEDIAFDSSDNMFLTANGAVCELLAGTNSPVTIYSGFSDPQSLAFAQAVQTPEPGMLSLIVSMGAAGVFSVRRKRKLCERNEN